MQRGSADDHGRPAYEHRHRYALAASLAAGADVLDLACGDGSGTAYLARSARSAIGVDGDDLFVRHAAARYPAMNLRFLNGQPDHIPFGDAQFDLVVSFDAIEGVADQEGMLAEIARVLRPTGRVLISSRNRMVSAELAFSGHYSARDLYFDEFRDLLRRRFGTCTIFGQRVFAASSVHALRGHGRSARLLTPEDELSASSSAPANPTHFIALCANAEATVGMDDIPSLFWDPADDIWSAARRAAVPGEATALAAVDDRRVVTAHRTYELPSADAPVEHEAGTDERVELLMTIERVEANWRDERHARERTQAELDAMRDALRTGDAEREELAQRVLAAEPLIAQSAARIEHLESAAAQMAADKAQLETQLASLHDEHRAAVQSLEQTHAEYLRFNAHVEQERVEWERALAAVRAECDAAERSAAEARADRDRAKQNARRAAQAELERADVAQQAIYAREQIAAQEAEIARLGAMLYAAEDRHAAERAETARAFEAHVARLAATGRDEVARANDARSAALALALRSLAGRLAACEAALAAASAEAERLQGSHSWRLTAPLRKSVALLLPRK